MLKAIDVFMNVLHILNIRIKIRFIQAEDIFNISVKYVVSTILENGNITKNLLSFQNETNRKVIKTISCDAPGAVYYIAQEILKS